MVETNPSRNSQLETHPDDERGRSAPGSAPHLMERFPHALKNSYFKPPRSGILDVLLCLYQM
jgi:hypothetical protein